MALGKQAKILTLKQEREVLGYVNETRYPLRNRVMVLLSVKAGLRAKEISCLTWSMVTDASGDLADTLHIPDTASKGKAGGRIIPLNPQLAEALRHLQQERGDRGQDDYAIVQSERGGAITPEGVKDWFGDTYQALGMKGCSSHSGRRTFITRAAKKVAEVGGSLRDVQQLAGHSSLAMTQRYIEGDSDAKRKLVALI